MEYHLNYWRRKEPFENFTLDSLPIANGNSISSCTVDYPIQGHCNDQFYGAFTLPNTDTDKMGEELYRYLGLYSTNTSMQFYTSYFYRSWCTVQYLYFTNTLLLFFIGKIIYFICVSHLHSLYSSSNFI